MFYIALLSLLLTSLSLQANETEISDYQTFLLNAQQHYQQKDYQKALVNYQYSYQQESLDSTLYNIAICQYKLKQWQPALTSFQQLQTSQPNSELIEYNIAVTQKKLGNTQEAEDIFQQLSLFAQDENIALLAEQQINPTFLNSTALKKTLNNSPSHWQSMLNVQVGNESNIVLPDDENFTEKSDQFIDYLFSTSWVSNQDLSNAWLAEFNYYGSKYSEASNYEVSMYSFSGRKFFTTNSLPKTRFYLGMAYESIDIAEQSYLDTTSLLLGAKYAFSTDQKLYIDFTYRDISEGSDRFDYLAGSSTRFKLTWKQYDDNGYWKIGGKLYIDDKNDRYLEDEFISYSADRYSLFLGRLWEYKQWDFELQGEYRFSEYHDHNIYEGYSDTLREDDKIGLFASLTYNISDSLYISGEYDYNDNSSTLEENDYDQTTASLGITWEF